MSYTKRAIEEIQAKGWPVNNDSLQKLVDEKEECLAVADIYSVANNLTIGLTDDQVKSILKDYPSAAVDDPTSNWKSIVENLIYNLKD